jgi:hypothetical protein
MTSSRNAASVCHALLKPLIEYEAAASTRLGENIKTFHKKASGKYKRSCSASPKGVVVWWVQKCAISCQKVKKKLTAHE